MAPAFEQRRIVAALEQQLSRIDVGVAALERAKANLERYRASVLKAACEGRLVPTEAELARTEGRSYESASELLARILKQRRERWEADQLGRMTARGKPPKDDAWKKKYPEPATPDTSALPELPEGWCWATVEQLTSRITSGSRDWSSFYGRGSGVFILAQNVRPRALDLSFRQLVDPPADDASVERSRVQEEDVLVTIVGANTGDVCRVPSPLADHFVCQSVALLRPVDLQLGQFLCTFLASPENGQRQFDAFMYGQGRPHLSFEQIGQTHVALAPMPEQLRIGAEIDRVLSIQSTAEVAIEAIRARASRLRQSLLAHAFSGKLVPQDPTDEPASVLLERIRKERESQELQTPKKTSRRAGPRARKRKTRPEAEA